MGFVDRLTGKTAAGKAREAGREQEKAFLRAGEIESEAAKKIADVRRRAIESATTIQQLAQSEAAGTITQAQRDILNQARQEYATLQSQMESPEFLFSGVQQQIPGMVTAGREELAEAIRGIPGIPQDFDAARLGLAEAGQALGQVEGRFAPISDIELAGLERQQAVLGGQAELATGAQQELGALLGLRGAESQAQAQEALLESPAQQALRERSQRLTTRAAAAIGGLGGGNVRRQLTQEARELDEAAIQRRISQLTGMTQLGAQGLGLTGTAMAAATPAQRAQLALQRGQLGLQESELGLRGAQLRSELGLRGTQLGLSGLELGGQLAAQRGQLGLGQAGIRMQQLGSLADIQSQLAQAMAQGILTPEQTRAARILGISEANVGGIAGQAEAQAGGITQGAGARAAGALGAEQARGQAISGLLGLGGMALGGAMSNPNFFKR